MNVVTAEHAKTLKDDTKVTLQGTIQSHIGGEIDQDWNTLTVDVKRLRKL